MSMKLHVVAASDIIQKGLDLSFPHHELGADGLLVGPSEQKILPAIVVLEQPEVAVPVDVPVFVDAQEPVEVPEPSEETKQPVEAIVEDEVPGLEVPALEEEKKPGKKAKKVQ